MKKCEKKNNKSSDNNKSTVYIEVFENTLIKYLRNIKNPQNPFLNKNFSFCAQEMPISNKVHRVGNIIIEYDDLRLKLTIKYANNDAVLAACIFSEINTNNYAYCPNTLFFINDVQIEINTYDVIEFYNLTYKRAQESATNINTLASQYEKTERGEEVFNYNKSLLFYIIDEYHEDDYYFNKEYAR